MNIKFLHLLFLASFSIVGFSQAVQVTTNKPFADYQAGETVIFRVESALQGQMNWEIKYNLRTPLITSGSVVHNGGITEIPFTLSEPAFITFTANINGNIGYTGATFSRSEIRALTDEPVDFDAFWQNQKNQLAAIPMDAQVWVRNRNQYSTTYQFSLGQIEGRRVHGYMVIPDGQGPFPATLHLPAYGRGANLVIPDIIEAERGSTIALSVNIHNVPPNQEDPQAYTPNIITDPNTIYYRYAILNAIRAIDFLQTRSEWNQRQLCIYGESQGGGLSMLVAGIDNRVTHLIQSVAALSQHAGKRFGVPSGFPYYLELAEALYLPDQSKVDEAFEAIKYYDAVFAARRFKGPSMHFVNYMDDICPAATHYAARNEMGGPKYTLHSLDRFHGSVFEYIDGRREFYREHFVRSRTPAFPFEDTKRSYFIDAGPSLIVPSDSAIALNPVYGLNVRPPAANWTAQWVQLSGPGQASFSNPTAPNTTVSFSDSGKYILQLRVVDPYPQESKKFWELTDQLTIDVMPGARIDTTMIDTMRTDTTGAGSAAYSIRKLQELSISPNPARDFIRLQAKFRQPVAYRLTVCDVLGRTVLDEQAMGGNSSSTFVKTSFIDRTIDLSGLPPGNYLLTISTSGQQYTELFVKQ